MTAGLPCGRSRSTGRIDELRYRGLPWQRPAVFHEWSFPELLSAVAASIDECFELAVRHLVSVHLEGTHRPIATNAAGIMRHAYHSEPAEPAGSRVKS